MYLTSEIVKIEFYLWNSQDATTAQTFLSFAFKDITSDWKYLAQITASKMDDIKVSRNAPVSHYAPAFPTLEKTENDAGQ